MGWLRMTGMVAVAVLLACTPARAQHAHDEPNVEPAKTVAESLQRMEQARATIELALASGKLEDADSGAFTLAMLARSLGRVAVADTTVARQNVKQLNLLGRQISTEADELHDAAGLGKLQDAKGHYEHLKPLMAKLKSASAGVAAAPLTQTYVCEMHCEGTKQYDKPGTCPVCKMELTELAKTPFYAKVAAKGTAGGVEAGKPTTLEITLFRPSGEPVGKVDSVHEYPLHFMIVSEDLSFYAHEHPSRKADGTFVLDGFTFPFGGRFIAFSDFTPTGEENQVARYEFKVPDGAVAKHELVKLVNDYDGVGKDGDYEFRVRCNGAEFVAGEDMFLRYGIDKAFKPVADLEPLMGAMGHLVIISADLKHYVHAHPLEFDEKKEAAEGAASGGAAHSHGGHTHGDAEILRKGREMLLGNGRPSDVVFHAVFPEPGMYRAFAQFQHKGRVLTYPVSIDVKPNPKGGAGAPKTDHSGHDHGATPKADAPAGGK